MLLLLYVKKYIVPVQTRSRQWIIVLLIEAVMNCTDNDSDSIVFNLKTTCSPRTGEMIYIYSTEARVFVRKMTERRNEKKRYEP